MIYKREKYYHLKFPWKGCMLYFFSTGQSDANVARILESRKRSELADGRAGVKKKKDAPTLRGWRHSSGSNSECESDAHKRHKQHRFGRQSCRKLLIWLGRSTVLPSVVCEQGQFPLRHCPADDGNRIFVRGVVLGFGEGSVWRGILREQRGRVKIVARVVEPKAGWKLHLVVHRKASCERWYGYTGPLPSVSECLVNLPTQFATIGDSEIVLRGFKIFVSKP
jgi:hypothetical protein